MAVCLQVLGLFLGVVSWCLQSSCTSSQTWKVRSQAETVTTSSWQFEGLWMSCAATAMGSVQCSRFKTVLGLPGHLQACRALMIMSLIIGLASIIISVLGLKCTKIGRTSEKVKEQIALSGGIMFILSGTRYLETEGLESVRMNERKHLKNRSLSSVFCPSGVFTLTAVSWYAARVINDFHDPFHGGLKFELGTGLYLGWASSSLAILGGSLLCCSCKRSPSTPPARQFSYYSNTGGGQSIYKAAPASESSSSKAYV
uniref:Claudin 15-like b n=1 Tax=Cyprinodon variegatus TaxID=28743 RepID=A0A3Q2D7X7_CYPVA